MKITLIALAIVVVAVIVWWIRRRRRITALEQAWLKNMAYFSGKQHFRIERP